MYKNPHLFVFLNKKVYFSQLARNPAAESFAGEAFRLMLMPRDLLASLSPALLVQHPYLKAQHDGVYGSGCKEYTADCPTKDFFEVELAS